MWVSLHLYHSGNRCLRTTTPALLPSFYPSSILLLATPLLSAIAHYLARFETERSQASPGWGMGKAGAHRQSEAGWGHLVLRASGAPPTFAHHPFATSFCYHIPMAEALRFPSPQIPPLSPLVCPAMPQPSLSPSLLPSLSPSLHPAVTPHTSAQALPAKLCPVNAPGASYLLLLLLHCVINYRRVTQLPSVWVGCLHRSNMWSCRETFSFQKCIYWEVRSVVTSTKTWLHFCSVPCRTRATARKGPEVLHCLSPQHVCSTCAACEAHKPKSP